MVKILQPGETVTTGNLGAFCPYWTRQDDVILVADTAEELALALPIARRVIDPVSVLELLNFNYMLGNRTLIQGVWRVPWRASLNWTGAIARCPPIAHGSRRISPSVVATRLRALLEHELLQVTSSHEDVYLLLSGGLDSRVVAGILKAIERQLDSRITCVTWGMEGSRDVTYARAIAERYGWGFVHIPYDAELTWANIARGAIWGGAEVAGIHLHGMDWFREHARPEDLVIAASFGDSIGRAEFSSVHLRDLLLAPIVNPWALLHPSLERASIATAYQDRALAWDAEISSLWYAREELDMQENYMRRMICHAMDYIRQFCSLHQAFTSDEVVELMWSLSPESRTDKVYQELLKELDSELYHLPWARTAIAPDGVSDDCRDLQREYHEWGKWLRHDLRSRLEQLIFSPALLDLGVFYGPSLKRAWKRFLSEPDDRYWYGETIAKIGSIELARQALRLQPCRHSSRFHDQVSSLVSELVSRGLSKARRLARKAKTAWEAPVVDAQ